MKLGTVAANRSSRRPEGSAVTHSASLTQPVGTPQPFRISSSLALAKASTWAMKSSVSFWISSVVLN